MAIFLLSALMASLLLVGGEDATCGVPDANALLDQVIEHGREAMEETFPLRSFDERIFKLTEGEIWGLNSIYRDGPVSVSCEGGVTKLSSAFKSTKPVRARYEWTAGMFLSGVAYLRSNVLMGEAVIVKQEGAWRMESMHVLDLEDIQVEVSGLGAVSWLWSKITSRLANTLDDVVAKVVEGPLLKVFNQVLAEHTG